MGAIRCCSSLSLFEAVARLVLAKPVGGGFITELTVTDRLFFVSILDDHTISVLYQTGKIFRHAQYSVATLAKVSDRKIMAILGFECVSRLTLLAKQMNSYPQGSRDDYRKNHGVPGVVYLLDNPGLRAGIYKE